MPLRAVGTNTNPFGQLEEYHYYREGEFYYIYYCGNCARNFETTEAATGCKFCNGSVKLVFHKEGQRKAMHRYFCQNCDIIVETNAKKTSCDNCKGRLLEMYRWNDLNIVDHLMLKIAKTRKSSTRFFLPLQKI